VVVVMMVLVMQFALGGYEWGKEVDEIGSIVEI
jgi:hypothetical protein